MIAAVFRGGPIPTGDAILIDDVLDGGAESCMADDCEAIAEAVVELHYGTPHLRRSVQIALCGRDYAAWCADWPVDGDDD